MRYMSHKQCNLSGQLLGCTAKCLFTREQRSQRMGPLRANACKAIGKLHV